MIFVEKTQAAAFGLHTMMATLVQVSMKQSLFSLSVAIKSNLFEDRLATDVPQKAPHLWDRLPVPYP